MPFSGIALSDRDLNAATLLQAAMRFGQLCRRAAPLYDHGRQRIASCPERSRTKPTLARSTTCLVRATEDHCRNLSGVKRWQRAKKTKCSHNWTAFFCDGIAARFARCLVRLQRDRFGRLFSSLAGTQKQPSEHTKLDCTSFTRVATMLTYSAVFAIPLLLAWGRPATSRGDFNRSFGVLRRPSCVYWAPVRGRS